MSSSDNKLNGCRVLIEGEYFLVNDLEEALKSQGARIVGPFGRFDAAYRQAARDHFEVAIVDVNLHGKMAYPIADVLIGQRIPLSSVLDIAPTSSRSALQARDCGRSLSNRQSSLSTLGNCVGDELLRPRIAQLRFNAFAARRGFLEEAGPGPSNGEA